MEQDGFYIGTELQCQAYLGKVALLEGFNEVDGDGTKKWANIKPHPSTENLFSIPKHNRHSDPTMQWVASLDATWEIPIEE